MAQLLNTPLTIARIQPAKAADGRGSVSAYKTKDKSARVWNKVKNALCFIADGTGHYMQINLRYFK